MPDGERRLAAIMFTDIVGYTALTQRDESSTLQVLEKHRSLLRPHFSSHGGREIKSIGDAFLVEFQSALDAVLCAVAVQQTMHDRKVATGEAVSIRIGIHVGDVVEKGSDILGDAVNIASRIEPLAEPGGVCISDEVYKQVRNKSDLPFVSLGEKSLKNVSMPIEVFKAMMPWERPARTEGPAYPSNRVAILPFRNMSPDPNDEYFAESITEEIISTVSGISGLSVISRTSVMHYKKSEKTVKEIGSELEVGSVLEGSLRKAGNRIRVTTQLIDVAQDRHLWAQNYDRNLDDVFEVQSDVAKQVAEALRVKILTPEKERIEKKPTESTEAYTDYLQGMQLLNRLGEEPLRDALRLFQRAVERDPSFARAYAGMADAYTWLAARGYISAQEAIDRGRAAAQKALELDQGLAEAHYGMAAVAGLADDEEGAMRELKRTLELNPSLAKAYVLLADESASLGEVGEMVGAAEKGYQLDPLSPWAIQWLGMAYFYTGRGEEAMEHWKKTLQLEPYRIYRLMFDYYVSKGDYAKAEEIVKELERLGPTLIATYLNRGYLAALTGDVKTAHEMIAKLDPGKGLGVVSYAGFVYYALGDMDRFFECMFRAADDHSLQSAAFRLNPLFEKARGDPRFGEVLRRAGLPYEPKS